MRVVGWIIYKLLLVSGIMWFDDAFSELGLFPSDISIRYSGKFRGFNANIRKTKNSYDVRMARNWESVDEDIRKGCVQSILVRLEKLSIQTVSMDLYHSFLYAMPDYAPKTHVDSLLEKRFWILNDEYFDGMMAIPNLEWGSESYRQLGRYEYGTDTVRLSTILKDDIDMLDFVLYHELLHKKHRFTCSGRHHTPAFRADERKFRVPDADKVLERFVASKKRQKKRGVFAFLTR